MADVPIVPPIDYSSRDNVAIRADMIRAIPLYTPEWTDHNPTDLGIVLLSILAGHLDVLHFYIDRTAGEMYLPTAVKRESVVKILRLIGYELRSIVPSSVDVVFSLLAPLPNAVVIPEGTKVQTVAFEQGEPVVFETTAALTIPAGSLTGTVSVREGESGQEDLGTSSGQAFQQIPVDATTIVEDSFEFLVDEGAGYVLWTQVESFVDSLPTSTHYRIERDASDKITVLLGDNLQGRIPPATSRYLARFVTVSGDRGGVFGNVGANTITIIQDTVFSAGTRVTLQVTNPTQASGGEDRESIEEAKRLGPASLRALNRAVTATDYKTLVEQQGGVAKAKVVQGTSSDPCCACALDIFVAPTGGGTLSTLAKDALVSFLDGKKMVGTCVEIRDPTYVDVAVEGTIYIFSNVDAATTEDAVLAQIDAFFNLESETIDFGRDVFLGNLFAQLENVAGVDHVDLSKVTRIPTPVFETAGGDASIPAGVTVGQGAKDEEWEIIFISPTTFTVRGSVSGLQVNTGTVGVLYESDDDEVAFTVVAGATPMVVGDKATFKTSPILGNVPMDPTEIPAKGPVALTFAVLANTQSGQTC